MYSERREDASTNTSTIEEETEEVKEIVLANRRIDIGEVVEDWLAPLDFYQRFEVPRNSYRNCSISMTSALPLSSWTMSRTTQTYCRESLLVTMNEHYGYVV